MCHFIKLSMRTAFPDYAYKFCFSLLELKVCFNLLIYNNLHFYQIDQANEFAIRYELSAIMHFKDK